CNVELIELGACTKAAQIDVECASRGLYVIACDIDDPGWARRRGRFVRTDDGARVRYVACNRSRAGEKTAVDVERGAAGNIPTHQNRSAVSLRVTVCKLQRAACRFDCAGVVERHAVEGRRSRPG